MCADPIALTCGEPAGIGPELAALAWQALKDELPFVWIGEPGHLPGETRYIEIDTPADAASVMPQALPVMTHRFKGARQPGLPQARQARQVIEAIDAVAARAGLR